MIIKVSEQKALAERLMVMQMQMIYVSCVRGDDWIYILSHIASYMGHMICTMQ